MLSTFKDVPAPTFEELLLEDVLAALRDTGFFELNELDVTVDGHDVSLNGWVSTYYIKQKAEFAVRSLPDVGVLKSEIGVTRH